MNKRAALGLMLAAVSVPAFAQYGGRRRGGMDKGGGMEKGGEPPINALELMVHELEEDLKLTAGQQPLWNAYVEKVRALATDVARERSRRPAPASVSQQIDRVVDGARNRLTALEEIGDSAKALYAKLAPEQQPAADPRLANLMSLPLGADWSSPRRRGSS